jgi:nicotinamidase-related amidase
MRHLSLADKSDCCLVVVDLQEPFLRTMFDRQMVIENAGKLIQAARIMHLPTLVTLQNPEKMGDTIPEIKELLPPHEPISKMAFSCCGDQGFKLRLQGLGKKQVILCGVEAHVCISQTAHDLVAGGYKVHVPEDAVCSRRERDWRTGLEKMRQSGIIVTSTEAVVFELLERAGTDEFREVLRLLK